MLGLQFQQELLLSAVVAGPNWGTHSVPIDSVTANVRLLDLTLGSVVDVAAAQCLDAAARLAVAVA